VHAIDLHQHLWPEPVLRVLERRLALPAARWRRGRWSVLLPGEPPFSIDPEDQDGEARGAAVIAAGLDRALVSLSGPLGAETLGPAEALSILHAWRAAAVELPEPLGWWAPVALHDSDSARRSWLEECLEAGAAGLCLPAGALSRPAADEGLLNTLGLLEEWQLPVFVHPGPAGGDPGDPAWWSPCSSYVAQLHGAWHGFAAWVRPALPKLRVVFAALAGLAPVHAERVGARGGPVNLAHDALAFYEPSSYGPRAVRAIGTAVGTGQLVHGTDHPVVQVADDPVALAFGDATASLARRENPARLLGLTWQPA
jgi:6-methylsalicylate decarboxylase